MDFSAQVNIFYELWIDFFESRRRFIPGFKVTALKQAQHCIRKFNRCCKLERGQGHYYTSGKNTMFQEDGKFALTAHNWQN